MKLNAKITCLLSLILGAVIFMSIYGYSILNPFNVDWIKNWGSDQEFHYIGWLFFKNAPFNFPLGMFDTLSYPNNVSTIFTDSIPIVAITCKAIIKIFNFQGEIQYFGLYGLLCFMLQSFFGMLIGKKITKSNFIALLIGGLFTFQPILFNKMFLHTALCSHYLILASILCVLYYKELSEKKYLKYITWSIISLLTASVHMYFIPFCGILLLSFCFVDFYTIYQNKSFKFALFSSIKLLSLYSFVGLLTIYIIGGFSSPINFSNVIEDKLATTIYPSADILTFFDPQEFVSRFLNYRIYKYGLTDCIGYIGYGGIFLLLCTIATNLILYKSKIKDSITSNHITFFALFFAFAFSYIIAILPEIRLNDNVIATISLPNIFNQLHSIFAANGRFIYISVYLLNVFMIFSLSKWKNSILIFILISFFIIQISDLFFYLNARHQRHRLSKTFENPLPKLNFTNANPIILNGIKGVNFSSMNLVAHEAYKNNLSLSYYHFARPLDMKINYFEQKLKNPEKNDIFVFSNENDENLAKLKCSQKESIYYKKFNKTFCLIICKI